MRKACVAEGVVSSGPYSLAIDSGEYVYVSGQTAKNSSDSTTENLDIKQQTEGCFKNIFKILHSINLSEKNVVKVNVYLTNMKNFHTMNETYKTMFTEPYPARTTVGVLELPLGADVEIEVVAKK